jgi:hypothetical protein
MQGTHTKLKNFHVVTEVLKENLYMQGSICMQMNLDAATE